MRSELEIEDSESIMTSSAKRDLRVLGRSLGSLDI